MNSFALCDRLLKHQFEEILLFLLGSRSLRRKLKTNLNEQNPSCMSLVEACTVPNADVFMKCDILSDI